MRYLLQSFIDAVSLGCLYALIALGIALIFGIMRLVNFAHGEFIMVGGYLILMFDGEPAPVIILATLIGVVLLALLTERVAFRPVRSANPSTLFITSFAVSYLIQNIVIIFVGGRPRGVSLPLALSNPVTLAGLTFPLVNVITVLIAAALIVALGAFLKLTPIGLQMRATAEDFQMARLLGVKANATITMAFGLTGVLAATVALILLVQTAQVSPTMGTQPVIIGFVATVVGGLGSLGAAGLGGFLIGFITVALQVALPEELRPFRDAFVFALVFIILIVRPQGLISMGSLQERV